MLNVFVAILCLIAAALMWREYRILRSLMHLFLFSWNIFLALLNIAVAITRALE